MYFRFNINISDKDYLEYNKFWMIKSPYGKKQIAQYRVILAIFFLVISFVYLIFRDFSTDAFIGIIPYWILFAIVQLLFNSFFVWILKGQLKSLRKKGKMGYSPVAEMEFHEETFVETTPENKTEQKYTAIERVSVIADKVIYIHVNNVMSYILPRSCFESKENYDAFLEFIKTKCANIDIY